MKISEQKIYKQKSDKLSKSNYLSICIFGAYRNVCSSSKKIYSANL